MAKLGPYSYPDIRFGDSVEIAGRILAKFKGTVNVKGLAWELGMAENSGTLFAKVAALRDFGLIEGRGELRITPLAQRILHPANAEEARGARAGAFGRVELLRMLHERFDGEVPEDDALLIGLEEITKAPRGEIVRRAALIQKHLVDANRVLFRSVDNSPHRLTNFGIKSQNIPDALAKGTEYSATAPIVSGESRGTGSRDLSVTAGTAELSAPLTVQYVDIAIDLLQAVRKRLKSGDSGGDSEG